ncbi:Carotenoid oxygenase [Geobacter metallireducens RCH3]|uniref:Dioxygenase, putative n=1 Tax=Geobacter metallireducens (strain ATCC 53774 / DSM 7210 / GS-15) TaxID=269799 RepID=Q39SV3_GEOMG|nr:carotenoid oxygenase family protein [Geobacter metallireducens]ABB32671.1 dioxygenase, putative [Geobacter metallireducens GS-15]EHP87836.1 Carotenoid oxygenase [Geobacter metallireducens RCH3]
MNINRRDFLKLAGAGGLALALPGCAGNLPLPKEVFPDFGDSGRPWLGLATSLREEHDYEARIEGTIPSALRGTLYRNGPALFDRGGLRKRTLLDGDGMVQSFTVGDGGVRYRNRYVRTEKFVAEEAAGRFLYPTWSTQKPGGFWGNFWQAGSVPNQAGITVFWWRGKLYAFDEGNIPYELDPESLATAGPSNLGLTPGTAFYSAHPKLDPHTGEWLHFGVKYGPRPLLHLSAFAADGSLKRHRTFPLPRYVYMHDWIVSGRYLILSLHPVEIEFWGFLLGFRSLFASLRWRPEWGNLLMIVEREGEGKPRLVETEACYMWHSFNAYEEGGETVADFIGYRNPDHFVGDDPVISAVMEGRRGHYDFPGEIMRYRIDPVRCTVRRETLNPGSCEWPRIDERLRCRRHRIGYAVKCLPGEFFWSIVMRVDFLSGTTAEYSFGRGKYCTEAVFVPKPGTSADASQSAGEGWLLTEVYDSHTRKSFLAILDAGRVADGPLAIAHLTHHVPFSYHGWWHPSPV